MFALACLHLCIADTYLFPAIQHLPYFAFCLDHKDSTSRPFPNSFTNHTPFSEAEADFHLGKIDNLVSWGDGLHPYRELAQEQRDRLNL